MTSSLHSDRFLLLPSSSSGHFHHIFRIFYGGIVPEFCMLSHADFCDREESLEDLEKKMCTYCISPYCPL
jgi:hypothetical protein